MRRVVVVALLAGCSAPPPALPTCSARVSEPLVNAATGETYLGLAPEQLRSIAQISTGVEPEAPLCSGVFVTPEWVVTAAHCLVIESPRVIVTPDGGAPELLAVVDEVAHPSVDVALIRVSARPSSPIQPLPPLRADDRAIAVEDDVELAGYGLTETGSTRELRFLVERVTTVDADSVVVNGLGDNGACSGDSGGPLVVRDAAGAVRVGGVLTAGSASCLENDRYVRLDQVSAWVEDVTGGDGSSFAACGGIDETGRCLYGSALHCDGGKLAAEACGDGRACGWDDASAGFRCVVPVEDPCDGVDSVGTCRDGVALRCQEGALSREPCGCGQTCRIDGRTGAPRCTE